MYALFVRLTFAPFIDTPNRRHGLPDAMRNNCSMVCACKSPQLWRFETRNNVARCWPMTIAACASFHREKSSDLRRIFAFTNQWIEHVRSSSTQRNRSQFFESHFTQIWFPFRGIDAQSLKWQCITDFQKWFAKSFETASVRSEIILNSNRYWWRMRSPNDDSIRIRAIFGMWRVIFCTKEFVVACDN